MDGVIALQPSALIDPIPELAAGDREWVLAGPLDFTRWDDLFAAAPAADDYLLTPGDYRYWGTCRTRRANPADRRGVIRFVDPDRKAWQPSEAVVTGFEFLEGAAHWVVHGLTLRGGGSTACYVRPGAEHIVFDSMLIEDFGAYGVRLFGNFATVQNSVIRRMAPGVDGCAIEIRVLDDPIAGFRVLDNEIYDCNDGVGVIWNSRAGADWAGDTNVTAGDDEMRDVLVMCRRWTHPDLICLHGAATSSWGSA